MPFPTLSQVVRDFGLLAHKKFSKSLGQNFLLDSNITQKIVRYLSAHLTDSVVVEIGPGPGGLTRAVLDHKPKELHVIEMDEKCIKVMEHLQSHYPNLVIHHQDALSFNYSSFEEPIHVVSNLPYHIGTELLLIWLKNLKIIKTMTLMFQKEVADRILATPGNKAYGRLSVISQYCCMIDKNMTLSPEMFTPPPKVHSTVLNFKPKSNIDMTLIPYLEKITAAAFGMRRKMIKTSLKSIFTQNEMEELAINPTLRAENLNLDDYIFLSSYLKKRDNSDVPSTH